MLAFSCTLLVAGVTNTFPVFFPPLLAEFGGSRAATAFTITLMWTGGAVFGPLAGWAVARWNPRAIVMIGLAAATLGFGVGTVARTLRVFTLAVGTGAGIGVGLTGMVAQAALLADAYVRRRGVAMGIAFSGAMAGYGLAPVCQWVITRFGWRAALAGYVVAVAALMPLAWAVLPTRLRTAVGQPAAAPARDPSTVRGDRRSGAVLASPPGPHHAAALRRARHDPAHPVPDGAWVLGRRRVRDARGRGRPGRERPRAVRAHGRSPGRTVSGIRVVRLDVPRLACLLALEAWPARLLAYGYVLFLFLSMGSRATIGSVLVGRIAPPTHYGVVFGLLGIGNSLGSALGPFLAGALHDWTGSYVVIYASAIALLGVAVAALAAFCLIAKG